MSSFSSFVFAADLHLRPCAWVGRPSLNGDAYYALQQIVDLIVHQRMHGLVTDA